MNGVTPIRREFTVEDQRGYCIGQYKPAEDSLKHWLEETAEQLYADDPSERTRILKPYSKLTKKPDYSVLASAIKEKLEKLPADSIHWHNLVGCIKLADRALKYRIEDRELLGTRADARHRVWVDTLDHVRQILGEIQEEHPTNRAAKSLVAAVNDKDSTVVVECDNSPSGVETGAENQSQDPDVIIPLTDVSSLSDTGQTTSSSDPANYEDISIAKRLSGPYILRFDVPADVLIRYREEDAEAVRRKTKEGEAKAVDEQRKKDEADQKEEREALKQELQSLNQRLFAQEASQQQIVKDFDKKLFDQEAAGKKMTLVAVLASVGIVISLLVFMDYVRDLWSGQ